MIGKSRRMHVMAKASDSAMDSIAIWDKMKNKVESCMYLENAAQKFAEVMHNELKDSIVLARLFCAIPFGDLPDFNRNFVARLAGSAGISHLIKDSTLILSLLGTHGKETAWNDRINSKGHVGIPLASTDFVDRIPMVSRLLKELGIDLNWISGDDTEIVIKKSGGMSGVFYVRDAETATDNMARKIITSQDFVRKYNIKTVFGMGGSYMGKIFITTIVFTNETLDKETVTKYTPIINYFKGATMQLAMGNKIFA
jgi:two-component system, NtrC family, sensor kinase